MQASDGRPERIPQEGHQRPELRFLNRYVRSSVGRKWYDLGVELLDFNGIEELNTTEAEYSSDLNKCCTKMFNLWLKNQPTASWNQLIEALRQPSVDLGTLASKTKQMLLQVPTSQSEEADMQPDARQNGESNQVEQTNVPTNQSEETDMQSDDNQPRQNAGSFLLEHTNVTNEAMECVEVTKSFKEFLLMRLRGKFSEVIVTLIRIFKEKNVDIGELITTLCFDDADKTTIFSTDTAFNTIRTVDRLLHHVAKCCKSIYDYEVLDILVRGSKCPEAIKELSDFTEFLQNSILTEIDLMSEHGELLHPDDFMPGTYKFIIEYVGGKCKKGTKEMVQSIVEQSVRLKKGNLMFKGFDVASILFLFQISEVVKDYLLQYKFTEQDIRFLEGNNIISLTVDRVRIMSLSQSNKIKMTVSKEENGVSTDKPHIILYPKRKHSEGRYGRVYAATFYGTECVAKEMHYFEENTIDLLINAFEKEIKMIQQLKHPNIVELFDVCRRNDSSSLPIFIMSKMFMTLNSFLEKYPDESFLYHKICILHNITCGLHYLHSQDIIHRDLTVNAIYLTEDLFAKIAHFGHAKDFKQSQKKLTYSPGYVHHMPPEALDDDPKYSFKLDIFSFGCVVIQVIINEIPVPSLETHREQPEGSRNYIEITEVERRKDHIKKITDRKLYKLHKIVKKCLQNKPDDRPTAFDLLPEMQKCKETQTKTKESILAEKTKVELISRIVKIDPERELSHRFGKNGNVADSLKSEKKESFIKGTEEWRQYLKKNQYDLAVKLSGVVKGILYIIRADITDEEYFDVMAISNPMDKMAKVIDILCIRQREVCKKFCHALKEVKFGELSQPLLKLLD